MNKRMCYRCFAVDEPKRRYDHKAGIWRLGCSACSSFVFFEGVLKP